MDYTKLQATAERLIRKFGSPLQISKTVISTEDFAGSDITTSELSYSVFGVGMNYTEDMSFGTKAESIPLTSERRVFLIESKSGYSPNLNDILYEEDGSIWIISAYEKIRPAGVSVYFRILVNS